MLIIIIIYLLVSKHSAKPFINIIEFFFLNFLTFIYFWDRERQSMNRGGAEREGDTESETGSRLWAVSTEPDAGLELTDHDIMTGAEVGCLTNQATQAPHYWILKIILSLF